ncbi:hypothetical protein, partial [Thiolapillus sp.]
MEDSALAEAPSMTLKKAWLGYALGLVAMVAWWAILGIVMLIIGKNQPWLFLPLIIGYLIIGVTLNIKILRRIIQWHPIYSTIDNVANAKLGMIVFWPL